MVLSWEGELEHQWQTMSRRLRTYHDARIIRLGYDSLLTGTVQKAERRGEGQGGRVQVDVSR